jgi:hypothetical protein
MSGKSAEIAADPHQHHAPVLGGTLQNILQKFVAMIAPKSIFLVWDLFVARVGN